METPERPRSFIRARSVVWLAITLSAAAVAAAFWWGPSAGLRFALDRSFATLGYRVIDMGEASVSLLGRRIDIGRIELEQPGGGVVHLDLADLSISPAALFDGRIDVPRARISGLAIEIVRGSDGAIRVAGFPVAAAPPEATSITDKPALALGIGNLELTQSRVTLRSGTTRVEIEIASLVMSDLAIGNPASQVGYELTATVGGRPLKIVGTAMPFAPVPTFSVRLEAEALSLEPMSALLAPALAGSLDAKLVIEGDTTGRATAEGRIAIRAPSIAGVSAGSIAWTGSLTMPDVRRIQGKGVLDAAGLKVADKAVRATIGSLRLDGTFDAAIGGSAAFSGSLDLGDVAVSVDGSGEGTVKTVRVDMPQLRVAADGKVDGRFTLAATAIAGRSAAGVAGADTLQAQGVASAGNLAQTFEGSLAIGTPVFEGAAERYAAGRIGMEALRVDLNDGRGSVRGTTVIDGVAVRTVDIDLAAAIVKYDGSIDMRVDGATASGKLDAGKLRVTVPSADIVATLETAGYDGSLAAGSVPATVEGRVNAAGVRVIDGTGRELFAAGAVDIVGFAFGEAGTSAQHAAIVEPRVLRREKAMAGREAFGWRLRAPAATIEDARLSPEGGIAVALLRFDRPTIRVTRTKNGLLSFERGAPPVPGASGPVAPSPGLSLGRLEIANGRGTFEDRTPHDVVRVPFERLALTVSDLDDRRPERPSIVTLDARVGSFGTAKANGTAFPFAPRLSFDIEFAASAIDLPPISAYADDVLGVDVRTGTAAIEGRIVAREEKLEGTTKWRLANVRLDERGAGAGALAEQAGAPVGTVLSLLSDDDNNIELEIPIAGELFDPTFDTADAVRQAVGGALRGALSTTLTVLFPFGTFFSSVVDAERRGTGIALPVIAFPPGSNTFDTATGEVVAGLAKLLIARPAARLEVCGFAGPADIETLPRRPGARGPVDENALRRLAAARGEAVKRRLVENDRIDAARIFECRPVVEETPDAKPRAELRF
jgi:uncharacterized protein involved in outer membrane biogenesis